MAKSFSSRRISRAYKARRLSLADSRPTFGIGPGEWRNVRVALIPFQQGIRVFFRGHPYLWTTGARHFVECLVAFSSNLLLTAEYHTIRRRKPCPINELTMHAALMARCHQPAGFWTPCRCLPLMMSLGDAETFNHLLKSVDSAVLQLRQFVQTLRTSCALHSQFFTARQSCCSQDREALRILPDSCVFDDSSRN